MLIRNSNIMLNKNIINHINCNDNHIVDNYIAIQYMQIPLFIEKFITDIDLLDFKTKKDCRFASHNFKINFLSKNEIYQINGYKSLKKQIEWIAGRFLVKNMVKEFIDSASKTLPFLSIKNDVASFKEKTAGAVKLSEIEIGYKKEGEPFIEKYPYINISISHSGNYAASALSATSKIGIDIEKSDYISSQGFIKTAFTENEIESINSHTNGSNSDADYYKEVMKRWTIKEAFLKYIGKGFNEKLKAVEVLGDNSILYNGKNMDVIIKSFDLDEKHIISIISS